MLHIPLLFIYSIISRKEIEGLITKNGSIKPTSAANQLKVTVAKERSNQEPG